MTDTEKQREDAGGREEAEPSQERVDELGAHIDAVRQRVDDRIEPDQDDQSFIESGDNAPVDDTIVPPG